MAQAVELSSTGNFRNHTKTYADEKLSVNDSPNWVGEPDIMEFSAIGAGTFGKQDDSFIKQEQNDDMSAIQGRLSETRLSDASMFDDTFFDAVMRESIDGVGRDRESFDGIVKIEGAPTRTSVDQGYMGRGSLDYGFRGSLDMRGSLDIRASDLRGSIDQGHMGAGFEASIMKELGQHADEASTIAPDGSMLPPAAFSVHYMSQYSCAQNQLMQPPPKMTSSLAMLHSQQQPTPNFLGGVYSQSQFMIPVNPSMTHAQQPLHQQFMAMPQAFPQTMKNLITGIMKKPTPKPDTQVKRSAKKKATDPKASKSSAAATSSQTMSHDCNNGTPVNNKTSSYRGVSKASTNSWGAKFSGKRIKSTCKSEQEAAEVYDDFLRKQRPDLFMKLANFCPQCGADRVRGPQCMCFNDINSVC